MFVYSDTFKCMTAEISLMLHINRTFFDRKDFWWCSSQEITGILHKTNAKSWVILYGYHDYSHSSDGQNTECTLFTLIKHTNFDIKDTACLNMVHILQHRTSLQITVNTTYNGQCSGKEPLRSHGRQIWQIDKAVHTTTSSSEWREEWVRGRMDPSPWSIR